MFDGVAGENNDRALRPDSGRSPARRDVPDLIGGFSE